VSNPTARLDSMRFGPIQVEFDARVLRPRPWTIMQSEWAAALAATLPPGPILELCAGAGHIGLAAAVLAGRDLVQVEQDPFAASLAARNAATAGLGERTAVRVGRIQDVLAHDERFPLVIADPPYLPTCEVGQWPEDPPQAIDGGPDGLALVRVCLDVAARHMLPAGQLLLQVAGPAQAAQLGAELPTGLKMAEVSVVDAHRAVVRLSTNPLAR
jgi:release factor glutamine methyltransferase